MIFSSRRPDGSDGKIYQSVDGGPASPEPLSRHVLR